jgi:peptidoglycan/xylan/chitin deacetylase (PgdA/CDA1 family)
MGTPLDMFKEHIQVILNNEFKIVPEIKNPTNEVMICLDDGFRGIYDTKGFFIQHQIQPLIFIAVELIGKENYLSKEEILELQSMGFQFEGHTWSHRNLTQFSDEELKHELLDSKLYLSDFLGKEVKNLCFPKGYFSGKVIKQSLKYGYERLFSSLPGGYYDYIDENIYARNLVQFAKPKEVKYRLLGNSKFLRERAIKSYCKATVNS